MRWTRRRIVGAIAGGAIAGSFCRLARAKSARVERVRRRVEPDLVEAFATAGVAFPPQRLFLRAFKFEKLLQMWATPEPKGAMVMIEEHPICAASGLLGPKRRFGDRQVPEGIYEIDYLNPRSAYHLSLRIDYPNASDRVRGDRSALGGAIMVHGDCVSIGCIAIEDGPIERVFVSVEAARRAGKKRVPIHIFPRRMDDAGRAALEGAAPPDSDRARLWSELRPIYAAFETSRRVPEVVIDRATGAYRLAGPRRSNDA